MTFHKSRDAEHNQQRQILFGGAVEDLTLARNREIRRMLSASKRVHDLDEQIVEHEAVLDALRAEASTHDYASPKEA